MKKTRTMFVVLIALVVLVVVLIPTSVALADKECRAGTHYLPTWCLKGDTLRWEKRCNIPDAKPKWAKWCNRHTPVGLPD